MIKSFFQKFTSLVSRYEFLFLLVPFVCWLYCYRHFFMGRLSLEADAVSYAQQISFYTDNLTKGVFPLWDPQWCYGSPYHFFLRRIGDVNPLLFLVVLIKWIGIPSATAYLIFIGLYYFLAMGAFYLIVRFILADRFLAFTAYILLLFSSWGTELFFNYIVIIFVPMIWFIFFLIRFSHEQKKGFFLGMFICAGLVVTTYIPFFFLTILAIFTILYILFYGNAFLVFLNDTFRFLGKNKIFTSFCICFLIISCIPALLFYKESKSGEFVMPSRHSGSNVASAVAVGIDNVSSGDIISHGDIARIFNDQANLEMGDVFIPYIFFLVLLCTAAGRINKLIFFLLFNILALSLIAVTSAAGIYRFLYDHIFFFKLMRNIYYFFWLAILPMGILLAVTALKSLLTAIDRSSMKTAWGIYIVLCHLFFVLFLCRQQGVLMGAWVAVFVSLCYFLAYIRFEAKVSYPLGFCLFFLAIFIQSAQVYGILDNRLVRAESSVIHFEQSQKLPITPKMDLYYAPRWFAILVNYLDTQVLNNYIDHPFIFYDNVLPYTDGSDFFKEIQTSFASNANSAFVSKFESKPSDWRLDHDTPAQADLDPVSSGKLTVVHADANTWRLAAHLTRGQFLVINDNYDQDWHAFINGRPTRLLRTNISFKGLWVPAGESTVIVRFSHPLRYVLHFAMIALFAGTFLYLLVLLKNSRLFRMEN